ncbi:MAG TPA: sulfotransferase family protein [Acidimicrobiaceae bacterium]|nr:sulfotransferase family protein [Acidimicrobiaceae bacterium]
MTLQVVGAGAGRTGTMSLKAGLELLLGRPCYHMLEVFSHPEHVSMWRAAAEGDKVDWPTMLQDYGATSDFPACLFWSEILEANPDAVVVLSTRRDAETWWESASQTIFAIDGSQLPPEMTEWFDMWRAVSTARFTPNWSDRDAAIAAYERHNAEVRASAPPDRLVEWQPADGWQPLCDALGVVTPSEPFPHLNKREDFPGASPDTTLADVIDHFSQDAPGPPS